MKYLFTIVLLSLSFVCISQTEYTIGDTYSSFAKSYIPPENKNWTVTMIDDGCNITTNSYAIGNMGKGAAIVVPYDKSSGSMIFNYPFIIQSSTSYFIQCRAGNFVNVKVYPK